MSRLHDPADLSGCPLPEDIVDALPDLDSSELSGLLNAVLSGLLDTVIIQKDNHEIIWHNKSGGVDADAFCTARTGAR